MRARNKVRAKIEVRGQTKEREKKRKEQTKRAGRVFILWTRSNINFQKAGANLSSDDNTNDSARVERERE